MSKRKLGLFYRCCNLQNVKAVRPLIPRASEARNVHRGSWDPDVDRVE